MRLLKADPESKLFVLVFLEILRTSRTRYALRMSAFVARIGQVGGIQPFARGVLNGRQGSFLTGTSSGTGLLAAFCQRAGQFAFSEHDDRSRGGRAPRDG